MGFKSNFNFQPDITTLQSNMTTAQSDITTLQSAKADKAGPTFTGKATLAGIAYTFERITPVTTDSVVIGNNTSLYIINPAGTIAALTVTMPATPTAGQVVTISSSQIVTTLTLSGNTGQTIIGALAALAVGGFASYIWVNTDSKWYRCG